MTSTCGTIRSLYLFGCSLVALRLVLCLLVMHCGISLLPTRTYHPDEMRNRRYMISGAKEYYTKYN